MQSVTIIVGVVVVFLFLPTQKRKRSHIQYAQNARIVVVGNGPSVMTQERGDLIDAHDVVVRFNAAPLYPRYTGVRTSVHVISGGYVGSTPSGASRVMVYNHPLHRFRSCSSCAATLTPPYRGATNVMTYLTHLCQTHPHNEITLVGVDDIDWRNTTYEEAHYFPLRTPGKSRWNQWTDRIAMRFHRRENVELDELLRRYPNVRRIV